MGMDSVRRMAAQLLRVGESRIRFDPSRLENVAKVVTKDDVRKLIANDSITARKFKGVSRFRGRLHAKLRREGKGRGYGARRGTAGARMDSKVAWMRRVRAQRRVLSDLHERRSLTAGYRQIYLRIKGGAFRDVSHLKSYLREHELLKSK